MHVRVRGRASCPTLGRVGRIREISWHGATAAGIGQRFVARSWHGPQNQKPPLTSFLQVSSGFLLVAGAGFEPATSGL